MHLFGGTVAEAAERVTGPEFVQDVRKLFTDGFGEAPKEQEVESWRHVAGRRRGGQDRLFGRDRAVG